jgi:hypothetical protein
MDRAFTHRFNNADGTVDSICHRCFKTVATATVEAALDLPERGESWSWRSEQGGK